MTTAALSREETALSRDEAAEAPAETAPPRRSRKRLVAGLIAALAAAGTGGWVLAHRGLESTDDAQIDAELVALAARTSGVVVKVHFEDNDRVEAGRVLAEIDPEPAKAKLAQAEAILEGARAAAASPILSAAPRR